MLGQSCGLRLGGVLYRRGWVPRLTRGHSFFWVAKRKKPKKRRPLRYAAGFAGCPALLVRPGGCGTRAFGPQTVLADDPRPHSVARRCTRGKEKHTKRNLTPLAVDSRLVLDQPFASSSSARRDGKKGEDCLRAEGPSSAALPLWLSSAEHPAQPGDAVGARFLWLLSFCKKKESTPARQARNPAVTHRPRTSSFQLPAAFQVVLLLQPILQLRPRDPKQTCGAGEVAV